MRREWRPLLPSTPSPHLQVLGSFLAGAVVTFSGAANAASGATPVDIIDDRKAKATGYELIYEARDLDIPQAARDGMTQARSDLEATKRAVKEAEKRIDTLILPSIKKNYWCAVWHLLCAGDTAGIGIRPAGRVQRTNGRASTIPSPVPFYVLFCRTEAREELRRQVGTLRFDLNALASAKTKDAKKEAIALKKEFIAKVWGG
jgi:photosystem II oxygen-evolving enhancer protein 3